MRIESMEIYRGRKMEWWGSRRGRRGQSLVEFALTLPVLLTILAGLVEVANILTVYNRVQTAAREATRFGAMGGADQFIINVVEQASTNSLVVVPDRMRVWVVRPIINTSGSWKWLNADVSHPWGKDSKGNWMPVTCLYPSPCPAGATDPQFPITPAKVLQDIQGIGTPSEAAGISGSKFVIVVVYYEPDLVLNLPWFSRDGGRFPMWAYSIMNQEVPEQAVAQYTSGCTVYPIALSSTAIPANVAEGREFAVALNNEPTTRNGFRFLSWNSTHATETALTATSGACQGSLRFPGNSLCANEGYLEYLSSPEDRSIHIDNWVLYNPTTITTGVWNLLTTVPTTTVAAGHFYAPASPPNQLPRALRIIVYTYQDSVNPNPYLKDGYWQYKVSKFAVVRLIPTGSATPGTLNFRWVYWDDSCGNKPIP